MTKVSFISLGCSKNLVDTEVMLYKLHRAGFEIVSEPEEAEIVIINTCGFIESAKQEAIETILEFAQLKKEGQIQKLIIEGETLVDRQSGPVNGAASNPMAFACDLHAVQLSNFIDAVCGRGDLLITAAEGSRAVSLIEEIYQFGLQGR